MLGRRRGPQSFARVPVCLAGHGPYRFIWLEEGRSRAGLAFCLSLALSAIASSLPAQGGESLIGARGGAGAATLFVAAASPSMLVPSQARHAPAGSREGWEKGWAVPVLGWGKGVGGGRRDPWGYGVWEKESESKMLKSGWAPSKRAPKK